jgi:ABC-type molybdate transport system permease subunit
VLGVAVTILALAAQWAFATFLVVLAITTLLACATAASRLGPTSLPVAVLTFAVVVPPAALGAQLGALALDSLDLL